LSEREYKQPAIAEAIFELRFSAIDSWGISSFVEFAELAKQRGYPTLKDVEQGFQFTFPVRGGTSTGTGAPIMTPVTGRVQTWNEEETQLWQASQQLFAANRRSPYDGWEKFLTHILGGFEIYRQVAKPTQAEALVMQYVNRIEVDVSNSRPSDFVVFLPPEIQYADGFNNFICRTEQSFNEKERIVVTSARDLSAQSGVVIILEILYMAMQPNLEQKLLIDEIQVAHSRIIDAFEKSITDAQRERMEIC